MPRDLERAARTAIEQCLNVTEDDHLAVVTDHARTEVGDACYRVGREVAGAVTRVTYPPGDNHSEEPPEVVARALCDADAFLAPTTKSITHTEARTAAMAAESRGATLPGITPAVFAAGMDSDYTRVEENSNAVYDSLSGADEIRVTTPSGTDITFDTGERSWHPETGLARLPGSFTNLPAGEVYISPASAEGVVVVDGTFRPHGRLDAGHTVRLEVSDGRVTDIDDEAVAEMLAEAAAGADDPESVYNVAELGIGTNPGMDDLHGHVLIDEKMLGTVHIAVGHDASIGGDVTAPIHEDSIVTDPTIYADGAEVDLPF